MKTKEVFTTDGPGRILFFSDLHYNHLGILKHSGRPYQDVNSMNTAILEVLSEITEDDVVFDLGDTFWETPCQEIERILGNIKSSQIYKIVGNHDKYGLYFGQAPLRKYYAMISDSLDIKVLHDGAEYMVSLDHYPKVSWNHKPHGGLHLHGHCHGNIDSYNSGSPDLRVDVGLDAELSKKIGSWLIDFRDIIEYFKTKTGGTLDFKEWTRKSCKEL